MANILKLLGCILFCELVGFTSGFLSMGPGEWYSVLNKPFFNPPAWVFGPAWTILYAMMGIVLFLILTAYGSRFTALLAFSVQLTLNFLWSFLFFALKLPFVAFIELLFLWFAILWTIVEAYKLRKSAAYWLIPYILWVSFALVLNFSIVLLN